MTDPIADLLTRIRNAYLAKKTQVAVPYSKNKLQLVKLITKAGFLEEVSTTGTKTQKLIDINLKYINSQPAITSIKRISKPGRRLYLRHDAIKPVLFGKGLSIISTSKGLLADSQCRRLKIGGEIICKLW